jgi:hypothetical protein
MRIGAAIEGLSAADAADCMTPEQPASATNRELPSFAWEAAAPLSVDDGKSFIAPVDFDPAGAVLEMPAADDTGRSLLACELASTAGASSLRVGLLPHARIMAF